MTVCLRAGPRARVRSVLLGLTYARRSCLRARLRKGLEVEGLLRGGELALPHKNVQVKDFCALFMPDSKTLRV